MSDRALVSFVGAGPGDAELITVKGLRRLREADVVIHDRLIPRALLGEVGAGTEIIDVGKAPSRHCVSQDRINGLIVERARACGRVIRLKGGDPSLFGRLGEEITAVRAAGLPFEVIPGVTAATAAAALAGVSLTRRASTSMVVLATGTDHTGRATAALDWQLLARTDATLVFYMAVRGLETITATLTALGRDPREPALIVERAGMTDERAVASCVGEIAAAAHAAGVAAPAVLIIGAAAAAASGERWRGAHVGAPAAVGV